MSRAIAKPNTNPTRSSNAFADIEASLGIGTTRPGRPSLLDGKSGHNSALTAGKTGQDQSPNRGSIKLVEKAPVLDPSEDDYGSDFETYSDGFEDEAEDIGEGVPIPAQLPVPVQIESKNRPEPEVHVKIKAKRKHWIEPRTQRILENVNLREEQFELFSAEPNGRYRPRPGVSCSIQISDNWISSSAQTETIYTADGSVQCPDIRSESSVIDSVRLLKFVRAAAQTCEAVILQRRNIAQILSKKPDQSLDIGCPSLLKNRPIICMDCSPIQSQVILVGYESDGAQSALLCLWDMEQPTRPLKVLSCCGRVSSCLLVGHGGDILAVAGLEQGSLVLWDLREPDSFHKPVKNRNGDNAFLYRSATFSTDDYLEGNHSSPVHSLARPSSVNDFNGQIASMDSGGAVNVWTVLQISHDDLMDVGLSFHGRVKLMLSTLVRVESSVGIPLALEFVGPDGNDYLIAQGSQGVNRGKRFGNPPEPSTFFPACRSSDIPLTIASSHFIPNLFLVGYMTGSICLFCLGTSEPVSTWPSLFADSVVQCRWSTHMPSQFLALDRSGRLQLWDVVNMIQGPKLTIQLHPGASTFHTAIGNRVDQSMVIVSGTEDGYVRATLIEESRQKNGMTAQQMIQHMIRITS